MVQDFSLFITHWIHFSISGSLQNLAFILYPFLGRLCFWRFRFCKKISQLIIKMGQCSSFTFQNTSLYRFPRGNAEEKPSFNDLVSVVQENPSSEIEIGSSLTEPSLPEPSLPEMVPDVPEPAIETSNQEEAIVSVESVSSMDATIDSDSSN